MKSIYFLLGLLLIAIGCTPNAMRDFARNITNDDCQSVVMVGESKSVVRKNILKFKTQFKEDFTMIDSGDTLGYYTRLDLLPISALFLFEDDINVYQELDVYCSPCADEMISGILRDERYIFEAYDKVNYISTTDLKVVMRLKSPDDSEKSCHQIRVYQTKD